jgi:predicted N-acetyltransferase YhbS
VELVTLADVNRREWKQMIGDEPEPWGGGPAERLTWRDKTTHVGVRAEDGTLVALAGAVLADVEVGGAMRFRVLGIGSVFVARSVRGQGLTGKLLAGLLERPELDGAEHAMLFCRPQLAGLYAKHGFQDINAPVRAQQPSGAVEMPLHAMWRPLSDAAVWPEGPVEVRGLPF